MSKIYRLSDESARQLASAQVVNSASTLVKELLDNSLDAQASSVEVLISPNIVDKIEVRDNGGGIHPDDYDSLGRRGYTSKIRSFEELRLLGGKTLGFRGEALASINSLADVTIITRCADEPVAAQLHLVRESGGIQLNRQISAPAGTTVTATNLFGHLPVREQIASKESAKTIDKIKQLLKSYAIARPQLKLTFKVLQTPRHNWTYSPRRGAHVKEALLQILGKGLAAQSFEKVVEVPAESASAGGNEQPTTTPDESYTLEAYLMKPRADMVRSPKQRYFSVDSRPLLSGKGTVKKIQSLYVKHLTSSTQESGSQVSPDTFLRVNIKCPPDSYDVNVESSKDDVLFSDEKFILKIFDDLCADVYNTRKEIASTNFPHPQPDVELVPNRNIQASMTQTDTAPGQNNQPAFITNSLNQQLQKPGLTTKLTEESQSIPIDRGPSRPKDGNVRTMFNAINAQHIAQDTERTTSNNRIDNNVTDQISHWDVDMSRNFSERIPGEPSRKRFRPSQLGSTKSSVGQTDVSASKNQIQTNPWTMASRINQPGVTTTQRNSPLPLSLAACSRNAAPPASPEPPILQHPGAHLGDLAFSEVRPPSHGFSNHYQLLPGGPYCSPVSSPSEAPTSQESSSRQKSGQADRIHYQRRAQPPWTPPSSVDQDLNYSRARPRDHDVHLKQTKIPFKGNSAGNGKADTAEQVGNADQGLSPFVSRPMSELSSPEQIFVSTRQALDRGGQTQMMAGLTSQQHHMAGQPPASYARVPLGQIDNNAGVRMDRQMGRGRGPTQKSPPNQGPGYGFLQGKSPLPSEKNSTMPRKIRKINGHLLPLENIPAEHQTHCLRLMLKTDVENLMKRMKLFLPYDKYIAEETVEDGLDLNLTEGKQASERLKIIVSQKELASNVDKVGVDLDLSLKGKHTMG